MNGLGEPEHRRPSPFFWHPPERQTHGALQRYIVPRLRAPDREDNSFRSPNADRGPGPVNVAAEVTEKSAAEWTAIIKAFARENEADLVGITPMREEYVYEGYTIGHRFVIVIGVAHNYDELACVVDPAKRGDVYREFHTQYNRGARAASKLANYIREQGYPAESWLGPLADALLMIPAAIAAGLGELGKHGSMINRTYGSGFRLAAVTTDLPLIADRKDEFGADEFCANCQVCTNACPPEAISDEKKIVRGDKRWYVDFDKCIPFFGEQHACGICIAVCPWTRPGVADQLLVKIAAKVGKRAESGRPAQSS